MKNYKLLVLGALVSLNFISCAGVQPRSEQVAAKIEKEEPAETPEKIMERAADAFSSAPGLDVKQKEHLKDVYKNVYIESMKIRTEIGKAKTLLFKTLAQNNYKTKELNEIKRQIVALDKKRLQVMFDALDEVQKTVGTGENTRDFYQHFQEYEYPTHGHPLKMNE